MPPPPSTPAVGKVLRSAINAYLRSPRPWMPDLSRTLTVGNSLDHVLGQSCRWDEADLAACLLILSLARSRQPCGLNACLRALKHAAAELDLELPLETEGLTDPIG